MQFILLLYSEESGWAKLTQTEQEQAMVDYSTYIDTLMSVGVLKFVDRLQPSAMAKTVHVAPDKEEVIFGKKEVKDCPFVDAKEQLGGYFIIEVPSLAAAIEWAALCPGARHGVVEVRPSCCKPE